MQKRTFLLLWNPDEKMETGWRWEDYQDFLDGKKIYDDWTVHANRKNIRAQDRFFILRVRKDRGLIASGLIISNPFKKPRNSRTWVKVKFEKAVAVKDRLKIESLLQLNEIYWKKRKQCNGIEIPQDVVDEVDLLWKNNLPSSSFPRKLSDTELLDAEAIEGKRLKKWITFQKRNRRLIAEKKRTSNGHCEACEFNFAHFYGDELGLGYIIAHHDEPIGKRKRASKTTLKDISLVCANCHSMIHRNETCLTIAELKEIILKNKSHAKKRT